MKKKTYRPHEQAALTQKLIVSVSLILVIAVFMFNSKDGASAIYKKFTSTHLLSF